MAKKRLKLKDKQGNVIDYDISAASVTIDAEGKSVEVKLAELVAAIAETVTSVTFNGEPHSIFNRRIDLGNQMQADWEESSPTYPSYVRNKPNVVTGIKVGAGGSTITPSNGVVTLPESGGQVECDTEMSSTSENAVQNKVIKAYVDAVSARIDTLIGSGNVQGAIDTFNEVTAFLAGISSSDTLAAKLAQIQQSIPDTSGLATKTELQQGLGTKQDTLTFDNAPTANSNNPVKSSGIKTYVDGKATITGITTSQDGAFTITLSDGNSFTVNLTHSHPLYLKHWSGKQAAYDALSPDYDSDTLYLITESQT